MQHKTYIAGPWRGIPEWNKPAFERMTNCLLEWGHEPLNPHDWDKSEVDSNDLWKVPDDLDMRKVAEVDLFAIVRCCTAICLLEGWEKSSGARAEAFTAHWLGLEFFYESNNVMRISTAIGLLLGKEEPGTDKDILEEALELTKGDRQAQYGPPDQDFARTAAMWKTLFGWEVTSRQVALAMICLKLSRETHQNKRDNLVDISGYARCASLCAS